MVKVATYLATCGISIDLEATAAAAVPTLPPWVVEEAGHQQHLQQLLAAGGSKMGFYKQNIRGWRDGEVVTHAEYKIQPHLEKTMPWRRRRELSRFRTSSHCLRVEMDRYLPHHPPRNTRTCRLCNDEAVEDEHHMVFECCHPTLVQLRQDYSGLFGNGETAITTLPVFLQQQQHKQLASFLGACFTAGGYEERNQIAAQVTAARTARVVAAAAAAAAVPRRHSPRFTVPQG